MLKKILLKNMLTIFSSLGFLRISFILCSGMRISPLFISIARRIAPFILLEKNDLSVFSLSSESSKIDLSRRSTAFVNPKAPSCIKSFIVITPDACCVVENFLAIFSTNGKNFIISSSLLYPVSSLKDG